MEFNSSGAVIDAKGKNLALYLSYIKTLKLPTIKQLLKFHSCETFIELDINGRTEMLWEAITVEYLDWLYDLLYFEDRNQLVLEVAAGAGLLTKKLKELHKNKGFDCKLNFKASDSGAWNIPITNIVEIEDAYRSAKRHSPKTIIVSWPPLDAYWINDLIELKGVKSILIIGDRKRIFDFSHLNWSSLESPQQFSFVTQATNKKSKSKTFRISKNA